MNYRIATVHDCRHLAGMNLRLIRDEGHRNTMSLSELELRMVEWLEGTSPAVLLEDEQGATGYTLFKQKADSIDLRHFCIQSERHRQGGGDSMAPGERMA